MVKVYYLSRRNFVRQPPLRPVFLWIQHKLSDAASPALTEAAKSLEPLLEAPGTITVYRLDRHGDAG